MGGWPILFLVVAYTAALSCIYAAFKIGQTSGWAKGLKQLVIFLAFAVLYYLLESWAQLRAPYYFYPAIFPDMIPTYPWDSFAWFPPPALNECAFPAPRVPSISLTIPLLGASLTFAAMWTAELLRAPAWLQPFLAALVLLAVDGFLDPVLAVSIDCMTNVRFAEGLGFWHWHVHEGLGITWFGIPLFNYAAWYGAPLVLVAGVKIIDWIRLFIAWFLTKDSASPEPPPPKPSAFEFTFLLIIFLGFLIVFVTAPDFPWPIELQAAFLLLVVIGTLIAILWFVGSYVQTNPYRWEFIYPQLAGGAAFPLLGFLLAGLVLSIPYLWIVALVTVPLVVLYCIIAYINS